MVLFWMYGGYVWLTNQVPPAQTVHRLLLIAGMAAFFVCALAIPRAFTGGGVVFGIGYLLVVLVHAGLYAQVYERAVLRFVPFNMLGAVCLIAAGLLDRPAAYALWVAPMGLQYVAPPLLERSMRTAGRASTSARRTSSSAMVGCSSSPSVSRSPLSASVLATSAWMRQRLLPRLSG
jgi:low temperature requirement protein LtrA